MLVKSFEIAGSIYRKNLNRNEKVHLIKLKCTPTENYVKEYPSENGKSDEAVP